MSEQAITPRKRGPRPRPAAPAGRPITLEAATRAAILGNDRVHLVAVGKRLLAAPAGTALALVWGPLADEAVGTGQGLSVDPAVAERTLQDLIAEVDTELRSLGVDPGPNDMYSPQPAAAKGDGA